ncbi:MAG TPA: hypothetical protein G4O16_04935 [Dehalococcoidia bacterium]|nr:hypothetical protein [Dehalococcoidia bacterium]
MRIVTGIIMMIGGLCGAVIGFLGTVVVSSQIEIIDGMELSLTLAIFSVVVFLSGAANLFISNGH